MTAHGFEDVVSNNGFLLEIQTRIVNAPARVRIGGKVKDGVYTAKVGLDFLQIQKFRGVYFEPGIILMMREMLVPARREIVQNPDFPNASICQERVN